MWIHIFKLSEQVTPIRIPCDAGHRELVSMNEYKVANVAQGIDQIRRNAGISQVSDRTQITRRSRRLIEEEACWSNHGEGGRLGLTLTLTLCPESFPDPSWLQSARSPTSAAC